MLSVTDPSIYDQDPLRKVQSSTASNQIQTPVSAQTQCQLKALRAKQTAAALLALAHLSHPLVAPNFHFRLSMAS